MFENVRKILKFERSTSGNTLGKGHKYKKITKSTVVQKVVVRETLHGCMRLERYIGASFPKNTI
jgi:hypothetical protein